MKKERLKFDFRQAEKDDLLVLAKLLMNLSQILSHQGLKIQVKRTAPKSHLLSK